MVGVRIPDLSDVHLLTFVDLSLSFVFFWGGLVEFGLGLELGFLHIRPPWELKRQG